MPEDAAGRGGAVAAASSSYANRDPRTQRPLPWRQVPATGTRAHAPGPSSLWLCLYGVCCVVRLFAFVF